MEKDFKSVLEEKAKRINVNLSDKSIIDFYEYMQLLLEWNKKINLTAITEEDEIIVKHFVDSLTILKYIDEEEKIIDVGTGAGFPGIPLAIVKRKNKFTLVDSLNKRINFLKEVKEKIELNNIENHLILQFQGQLLS